VEVIVEFLVKMKSIRAPISSILRGRTYAAQAATKHADRKLNPSPQDVKVSRLPGGVVVMSLETYAPVSTLAVVYNTGSRSETHSELGLTHCLRMAVTQSAQKVTAFGIAKNLQQIGSSLTCTTSREQTIYSVQCLRSHFATGLQYLDQVASTPAFKPWELTDAQSRLKLDLELYSKSLDAMLMDALHKAAFRDTLGQSLFMNADRIGSYSPQALEAFVEKQYVSHNATVIGVGIDHDALVQAAKKLSVRQGAAPNVVKSKYHAGGEVRVDAPGKLVHAAVVSEGIALGSKDVVPAYVLQQALGGSASIQYGLNASSKINKAAQSVTNQPFTASCLTVNCSDSGLFGIYAVADTFNIGKVLRSVLNAMSQTVKNGFTDAEVQRAKARVKLLVEISAEDSVAVLDSLSTQGIYTNQPLTATQLSRLVDQVTVDDVNRVAKQLTSGKPSMAAVGNLVNTPYLDELL
jgi:ubiquinol-cytochrome c reductase core subunit 2